MHYYLNELPFLPICCMSVYYGVIDFTVDLPALKGIVHSKMKIQSFQT